MLAIVLSLALRKPFNAAMNAPLPPLRGRLLDALALLIVVGLSLQLISQDSPRAQGATPTRTNWPATARISSSQRSAITNWTTHSSTPACPLPWSPSSSRRTERTRRPLHR
jgi:hypothetical protein